jgi:hypothetical protein
MAVSQELHQRISAAKGAAKERLGQRLQSIKRLDHLHVNAINERVAVRSTIIFGSIWMFYLFFLYGFLPLLPQLAHYQDKFLYWGSWVQLWALPLLMVGGIVLNRSTERRAAEDHETLMGELAEIKEMHSELLGMLEIIRRIETETCPKQSA